ncbi:MAG TPA: tetratricopeptide repeat protein [Candidatus Eisenbacteria bacterium]|nr:tetratricopeptide repeat protein [Candidatus Eisenbacteria bacterium]
MPSRKEAPKGAARKGGEAKGAPAGRATFAPPRLGPKTLALIAGLAAGALYLPALQYGWVWDDALLGPAHGAGGAAAEGFRPLLGLLQRGEWLLGAGNPALFHLTNLLAHAVGTWLFFLLATSLGASAGVAFLTSLLFGAHPVHVESVAFISGRAAMLATVFSLAALLAARTPALLSPEGGRSRAIVWAYVLFAAAALTHEAALVTPFILAGLDRWGPVRVGSASRRAHYAGFLAIGIAAFALRFAFPGTAPAPLAERGLPEGRSVQAILASAGEYLNMMAWPSPLNAVRSLTPEAAASAGPLLTLLVAIALLGAFVWWRRGDPAARVGALILALGLLPILPYPGWWSPYAAERLAYLPSVGFVLLVAALLAALRDSLRGARSVVAATAFVAAGLAAYATLGRIPVWRDNVSLLQSSAAASPHDPEPYLELAAHHAAMGDPAAALAALDHAIARDPNREESYSRRALVLGTLGRWAEAEVSARRATELAPRSAEAWANLGDALAQQGKAAEAVSASRRAVEIDSTRAPLWYNLGVSLAAQQDVAGAARAYERALGLDSTDVGAWNNLGAIYGGMGRLEEAKHAYAKAVEIEPASLQARMNLALAYLRLGDRERAAEQRKVIQRMDAAAARQLSEFFQESDPKGAPAAPRR